MNSATGDGGRAGRSRATYGSSRQQGVSGKFIVIALVVVLVAVGVYVFSQFRNSSSADATATAAGHEVMGDTLRMTVDITRDDTDRPAHCIVTALDETHGEIGRREAVVAAGGSETTRLVVDIPTNSTPVAPDVYGCSATFPSYLDDSQTTPSAGGN